MKVIGLNGREYTFSKKQKNDKTKSQWHTKAVELVSKMFPNQTILEEVELPGTKDEGLLRNLYADIFLPNLKILIEVHGQQHYSYSSFFQKNEIEFWKQKKKDRHKKEWCKINNIIYVELPYNDEQNWERRILDSI
jgi:hypothetical protein